MTKKRLRELQTAFLSYWPRGVHGAGGFGKPGSFAAGGRVIVGFDNWEVTHGGWVVGHVSERNARFLCAFDPVVLQELLDGIAREKGMRTIWELTPTSQGFTAGRKGIMSRAKTRFCPQGHDKEKSGVYAYRDPFSGPNGQMKTKCRLCTIARNRKYKQHKRNLAKKLPHRNNS